jgi:nicotinate-nucleotide adenylyltransferase
MSGAGGASTGVFGGTFNPIHVGHLRAAEEVREQLGLARMLFLPSADPPLKRDGPGVIAPARDRLRWVRAAVASNPAFEAEPMELEREGPSYSVETLALLAERLGPERPVFVIGEDAFSDLGSWRDPDRLLTLCHFAVMRRPPGREGPMAGWLPDGLARAFEWAPDGRHGRHRSAGTWVRYVPIRALDVSATDVRRRIREGLSVRYLVPEEARDAVLESGHNARAADAAKQANGTSGREPR